jgi:hypothetical protein
MLAAYGGTVTMSSIEERFGRTFAHWGIALPPEDVRGRRRGKRSDVC